MIVIEVEEMQDTILEMMNKITALRTNLEYIEQQVRDMQMRLKKTQVQSRLDA